MYLNETLIIFVIGIFLFVIFLLILTLFIANYRNSSQREERLRSLAITPVQIFKDGSNTQSVNMQRVLRARLSEMKKLEKGGYRTKISNLILRSGSKYSYGRYLINSLLIFTFSFVPIFFFSNAIYALIFSRLQVLLVKIFISPAKLRDDKSNLQQTLPMP